MKKIIYTLFFVSSLVLVAQDNINYDGIFIGSYVPSQVENMPLAAKKMLSNKLSQIITQKGIGDTSYNSRFIITPNIAVLSKDVVPSAPPKVALNLEVTFYIGDGIDGTLYVSETVSAKGVGTNENKAYIAAVRQIRPKSPTLQDFVKRGKERVIEYYNNNCDLVLKKVDGLSARNQYEEALGVLAGVPEVSQCFDKVKGKMSSVYTKAINVSCKRKLNEANSIWSANQDLNAANAAGAILASIEPQADCFNEVKALYKNIAERVKTKELLDRDWQYKLKELDVERSRIQSARDIGVAQGLNQQPTYNIRGWY
ncbi:hypothetical protein ACFFU1_03300 [Algibacter miyuki]|uniref:Uncharacterized protein n=1 Tax=Algibacter miyuki TaxID=1306933 RepID=A0ABV5GW94_9FLAO|nr:hypothetical protein [Algibacter miyuki]MDN3665242.1 hypothetical protein [Algibacter miyuki]